MSCMVLSFCCGGGARLTCDPGSHSWTHPVETLPSVYGLHLCEAAVHTQLRARDVAAVVGSEKHHGLRDLICWPAAVEATRFFTPGVSMRPGLTAFTRMRRSFKSVVQVRANERRAAFAAQETLAAGGPLPAPMDAFRMIEAPSGNSGSAFCTVKSRPLTWMLKSES